MSTSLEINHHLDGDVNVITLEGEADNTNTELIFAKMHAKITPLHGKKVLLDLRKMIYCNSTFLGHTAALHVDLANKGGLLAIVVNGKILDPFTITGLDRLTLITLDFNTTLQKLKSSVSSVQI